MSEATSAVPVAQAEFDAWKAWVKQVVDDLEQRIEDLETVKAAADEGGIRLLPHWMFAPRGRLQGARDDEAVHAAEFHTGKPVEDVPEFPGVTDEG